MRKQKQTQKHVQVSVNSKQIPQHVKSLKGECIKSIYVYIFFKDRDLIAGHNLQPMCFSRAAYR